MTNCSTSNKMELEPKKVINIKWNRLVSKGETCQRCRSTEEELDKATFILKQSFTPLEIEVTIKKEDVAVTE